MSHLVLVTGGAGFIGSHLVDALLARGDRVRVLDDFSTGRRENLAHCLLDVELLEGDVRDLGLVGRAVAGCDGVLHEAAVASVALSLADPVGSDSVTHGGTVNVVTQARRAGVGAFVLASSCAVYGDAAGLPLREDAPPRPRSPYALAKLLSEEACGAPGMRAVCLRYFNVYGPRQDPSSEYSGVIARFTDVAARRAAARGARGPCATAGWGERCTPPAGSLPRYVVYGDGRQSRDFVYVADVVAANLLALDACLGDSPAVGAPGKPPGAPARGLVLNVGTGVQTSVLEIVAAVERIARGERLPTGGRDAVVERMAFGERVVAGRDAVAGDAADLVDFRPAREGDIRASQADVSLARAVLGYEPAVSFADGLAATYEWYARSG